MFTELMASGSGGGEMTVQENAIATGAATLTCTMRNGAYYDVRGGDTYGFYSYTKGYVENGVLHESYTNGNHSVTYNPNTNLLTITRPSSAPAGTMYFIIVD